MGRVHGCYGVTSFSGDNDRALCSASMYLAPAGKGVAEFGGNFRRASRNKIDPPHPPGGHRVPGGGGGEYATTRGTIGPAPPDAIPRLHVNAVTPPNAPRRTATARKPGHVNVTPRRPSPADPSRSTWEADRGLSSLLPFRPLSQAPPLPDFLSHSIEVFRASRHCRLPASASPAPWGMNRKCTENEPGGAPRGARRQCRHRGGERRRHRPELTGRRTYSRGALPDHPRPGARQRGKADPCSATEIRVRAGPPRLS